MTYMQRQTLYAVLGALLIAGCAWWWFANMEKRWTARPQISEAAMRNPMLAAERLLNRHRHHVDVSSSLAEAQRAPIPDGTLVLLDNGGLITREQADKLLAWTERGNTLIVRPKWSGRSSYFTCGESGAGTPPPAKHNAGEHDSDPIGAEYGVELSQMSRRKSSPATPEENSEDTSKNQPCLAHIAFPDSAHALRVDVEHFTLKSSAGKASPIFGDDTLDALRIYARGQGRVVFVAQNYFDNDHLGWYDNAELLVNLAELNHDARHVLIVQHLDMPPWYAALWWNFSLGIIGIGCFLVLLLWLALRRFGPLLPEPEQERRSLIEHIDASGRWLWKAPGGRDILLAAVRASTEKLLLRRMPELSRMQPEERAAKLAQTCGLPRADVADALLEPASRLPNEFTRQIQTLQQLRKHHER